MKPPKRVTGKILYIIRHAKSSWSYNLPDHDRPLGKRGRKDVIKMASYLAKNVPAPEAILCSTASRAFYTALFLADGWGIPEEQITLTKALFHASSKQIIDRISTIRETNTVAIFGHNPGFTDLQNLLSDQPAGNIPTCGVVGIELPIDTWSEITETKGRQIFFYAPKTI